MNETASQKQATIDRINQRFNTSPEFIKEVNDYFSKPVILNHQPTILLKKKNKINLNLINNIKKVISYL